MKTIIYGMIVLSMTLIAPANADDCGGVGYEPFKSAMDSRETNKTKTAIATRD